MCLEQCLHLVFDSVELNPTVSPTLPVIFQVTELVVLSQLFHLHSGIFLFSSIQYQMLRGLFVCWSCKLEKGVKVSLLLVLDKSRGATSIGCSTLLFHIGIIYILNLMNQAWFFKDSQTFFCLSKLTKD